MDVSALTENGKERSKPVCHTCGRPGHFARDCWQQAPGDDRRWQAAPWNSGRGKGGKSKDGKGKDGKGGKGKQ